MLNFWSLQPTQRPPLRLGKHCPHEQCDPENLKSPGQKILSNKINQFHEKFFDQIPFFAISKMAKNQFLNWEKV